MQEYDYVIAGGGGAGLGLANALLDSAQRQASILLIDKDFQKQNDRTWCFWGPPSTPFADLAAHSWGKIAVISEKGPNDIDLGDWRYWMVRGIDFYRSVQRRLEATPTVQFMQGHVDRIVDNGSNALVQVGSETIAARWVFDSTLGPQDLAVDVVHYHPIKQHFKGWEVEAESDIFDPDCVTLFDFRTPQADGLHFFYILPTSPRRALVEYTVFSANLLADEQYKARLRDYICNVLNLSDYRVLSEENGVIPMTDQPFMRRAGPHVMNIGTKGGLVKPSTGFAFARMQRDAHAIAASLDRWGHPFAIPCPPARYRLFDSILLQLIYRRGPQMAPIFTRLFERNSIRRVFDFLDEDTTLWQDAALIATLPPGPFLGALVKLTLTHRV